MNKSEMVQSLWERIKQPKHTMAVLTQIFEEYKATVADFAASSPEYQKALRHTPEEFPDLTRLIGKGHDAVLKGRLIDAIGALKKKVAELDPPPVEEAPQPTLEAPATEASASEEGAQPEKPKFRITPTLGMD